MIGPLEFEHIDDWSKVRAHEFINMIVLCANCHGRKGDGPGQIDRRSLRQYKANLSILNSRYKGVELQLLEWLVENPDQEGAAISRGMHWAVYGLIRDGVVRHIQVHPAPGVQMGYALLVDGLILTDAGKVLVGKIREGRPMNDLPE
ncbi:HNH endonuclease [Nonomuraea sp. NPDC050394]|uniref:HNH endonuclease n=1 Tax=Nonomuraea sp. NPDC050394 TaxID=3364363 RepID=UPI0037944962